MPRPADERIGENMAQLIEVKVPDIGDFSEVEVIEVLVKPGDTIRAEQSLVTVESDKASMEIPSAAAGVVRELKVALGDKVSEGRVLLLLEAAVSAEAPSAGVPATATAAAAAQAPATPAVGAATAEPPGVAANPQAPASAAMRASPSAASYAGPVDLRCEMLVLGGGPGGYSAAFRAADLGMQTVIVERYPVLGGVCLNVGCIPSKALLHTASVIDAARALATHGVSFGDPEIDLDALRAWKDRVVGRLTGGLAAMAKARKVELVRGSGSFLDANHLQVELTTGSGQERTGERKVIRFEKAIIAAGSQAVRLPFLPEDHRIVDSTGALELRTRPRRMLVIGGGIIGLEMGTVYSTLGARLDVVEAFDVMMPGADRDLVKAWQKFNAKRFDRVMLGTKTVKAVAHEEGIRVRVEGPQAPAEPQLYDLVLAAVGRSPNGGRIGAASAGVSVDARGFIAVDGQMRTNLPHVFAIGDLVGQPMLAHKAVHQGHVAAEAAAGQKSWFDARGDSLGGLHRPRDRLGRPDRGRGGEAGREARQGRLPLERLWTGDRQRSRRGLHQAALRRADPSGGGRRHRRYPCR